MALEEGEGGFTLERRDDGKLLFFQPDGALLPDVPKPPLKPRVIEAIVADAGVDVSRGLIRNAVGLLTAVRNG